jgi:Rgg/GadR/MutR family transcriptional activator
MDNALSYMYMTLGEFEYLVNHFAYDETEEVFLAIEHSYYKQDTASLKKIYADYLDTDKLVALSAKACYADLEEAERQEIASHFFGVSIWSFYELSVLSYTIEHLTPTMIISIISDWEKPTGAFKNIFKYRRRMQQALHRAVIALILAGEKVEAHNVLLYAEKQLFERDVFAKLLHKFAFGYYHYVFEDKAQGKSEMQYVIETYERVESTDLCDYYLKFYEDYVK